MTKSIEENFKDFDEQINNVRKWEIREITKDFFIDAYVLAKAILEHYDYDPFNMSTLTELGLDNIVNKHCYDISYGEYYENKNFYHAFALFSIVLKKHNQNYVFGKVTNKEEYIVETVTLLSIYIYGDYQYRKIKWLTTVSQRRDTRELPNVHIAIGDTKTKKDESESILYEHAFRQLYSLGRSECHDLINPRHNKMSAYRGGDNFDYYWRELNLSKKILDKMIKIAKILNKSKEYEKISQMQLTLSDFEKHKVDYRSFTPIEF